MSSMMENRVEVICFYLCSQLTSRLGTDADTVNRALS